MDILDILIQVFTKYIQPHNLEIVAAVFVVGLFIKYKTPLKDAWIIFILYILSLTLLILKGLGEPMNYYNLIVQSIFVTGAAVAINESPKQFKKLFGNTISNGVKTP